MNKSQILLLTLSVFVFVSFTINLLLFRELKQTFISLYQISLNPLALTKFDNQKIPSTELPRVVFFGDSRANDWQFPQNKNFQYINRGISGQTSAQILARFADHVAPLKPQVIVLQLGVNDLRMLPSSPQTRVDLVNNCQNNIAQIIEKADRINATVVLTTLFPLGSGNIPLKYRPFWANLDEMKQEIVRVNQDLKSFSDRKENRQVIILDAYTYLETEDANKVKYYKDLLHLNRRGYELLNQKLEKILREIQVK
jgi:lysophospholipase L1-like esterase